MALSVAVFDDTFKDDGVIATRLRAAGHELAVFEGCFGSHTPHTVSRQLQMRAADVVVWDISPATGMYCALLEHLLDNGAFGHCRVVITTTSAINVRVYFAGRDGALTVFQKPLAMEVFVECIERQRRN